MTKMENIEATLIQLKTRLAAATSKDARECIGSAIDAWNGMWMQERARLDNCRYADGTRVYC